MSLILSHLAAAVCGILATLALLGPYLRQLRRRSAAAEYDATHDALTGLTNRRGVLAHLCQATRRTERVGVILFDLDDFKSVNDTFGHAGGDDLLRQVARLLQALPAPVRLAARLGGDEFVIVVDGDADTTAAEAHQIWTLITGAPFTIAGHDVHIAASVGHVSSRLGWTGRKLLHYADLAMYDAKNAGGGVVAYHHMPADREVIDRPPRRCRDRRPPPRAGGSAPLNT
ncbi:diguanylate cyclase (GGDEF)-like protein [Micromonospora sp. Llam0]|uniref:GGDEF domain-containing protein n=1 Tax=Micromonospora sp. Llam0 TaxID=2485143 RepID=UPI000FBF035C|nr:GGDEF domain-containing protein [Micromonospora sp. Llam0]ROO63007.1 diguanylate cyclase (GGDEF)-like protein [Micromonospora sp. Llam0]